MSVVKRKVRSRYVRIDYTIYTSAAFTSLSGGALRLWLDLRIQFNGSNNGALAATMSVLAARGWTSNRKLHRALEELLEHGLIERTRLGKKGPGKVCSLFAFADLPVATNEAKLIAGRAASHAYLNWNAGAGKKSVHPKRVQHCTRIGSTTAPETGCSFSPPLPKRVHGKIAESPGKPRAPRLPAQSTHATELAPVSGEPYSYQPMPVDQRDGVAVDVDVPVVDRVVDDPVVRAAPAGPPDIPVFSTLTTPALSRATAKPKKTAKPKNSKPVPVPGIANIDSPEMQRRREKLKKWDGA